VEEGRGLCVLYEFSVSSEGTGIDPDDQEGSASACSYRRSGKGLVEPGSRGVSYNVRVRLRPCWAAQENCWVDVAVCSRSGS
jgi:hypothetical protein